LLLRDDNLATVDKRHEIRHVLAEHSSDVDGTIAYFDNLGIDVGRTRVWHAATSLLLAAVGFVALKGLSRKGTFSG
jgi:hypothetical protein